MLQDGAHIDHRHEGALFIAIELALLTCAICVGVGSNLNHAKSSSKATTEQHRATKHAFRAYTACAAVRVGCEALMQARVALFATSHARSPFAAVGLTLLCAQLAAQLLLCTLASMPQFIDTMAAYGSAIAALAHPCGVMACIALQHSMTRAAAPCHRKSLLLAGEWVVASSDVRNVLIVPLFEVAMLAMPDVFMATRAQHGSTTTVWQALLQLPVVRNSITGVAMCVAAAQLQTLVFGTSRAAPLLMAPTAVRAVVAAALTAAIVVDTALGMGSTACMHGNQTALPQHAALSSECGLHPVLLRFVSLASVAALLATACMAWLMRGDVAVNDNQVALKRVLSILQSLRGGKYAAAMIIPAVTAVQFAAIVAIALAAADNEVIDYRAAATVLLLVVFVGIVVELAAAAMLVRRQPPVAAAALPAAVDAGMLHAGLLATTQALHANASVRKAQPSTLDANNDRAYLRMQSDASADRSAPSPLLLSSVSDTQLDAAAADGDASLPRYLAQFRQFLRCADIGLSLADLLKGCANAVEEMFPGVSHAVLLFSPLDSTQQLAAVAAGDDSSVLYTLVADGVARCGRRGVRATRGTLTHHVLHTASPVFIRDCETPGLSFSDVQFMRFVLGLKSAACLPLKSRGGGVHGAMTLGFKVTQLWHEHECRRARQLARVFAERADVFDVSAARLDELDDQNAAAVTDEARVLLSLENYATIAKVAKMAYVNNIAAHAAPHEDVDDRGRGSSSYMEAMPSSSSSSAVSHDLSWDGDELYFSDNASQPDKEGHAGAGAADGSGVQILELIGRGAFGNVYRGNWNGDLVAVKVIDHGEEFKSLIEAPMASSHGGGDGEDDDGDGRRAAVLEGAMMSAISHPNVVRTFDYRFVDRGHGDGDAAAPHSAAQETHIIMEYCDKGSLQDAIENGMFHRDTGEQRVVDVEAIVRTLAEVASAMDYLHSIRITHRDLKPKNILLKSADADRRGFVAKVSDFGLSQILNDKGGTHISTKYSGTITHMPPELIEDGKVYSKGDVYAFAIMCWEMFTAQQPFQNMARPQIMVGVVNHNLRPPFPADAPPWFVGMVESCWHKNPAERPTFSRIAQQLQDVIERRLWEP